MAMVSISVIGANPKTRPSPPRGWLCASALLWIFCWSVANAQIGQPNYGLPGGQRQPGRFQTIQPTAADHLTFNDGWSVGLSAEHSDNILRADTVKEDSMIYSGFLNFNLGIAQPRWSVTAASNISYQTY